MGAYTYIAILARVGAYLGYHFRTFSYIEAATLTLEMRYMGAYLGVGACPGH